MMPATNKPALLFALLIAASWSSTAAAIPVLWTLEDVEFEDGGTAAGSFVYDADTNAYSSVSILSTAGTAFGGAAYDDLLAGSDLDAALIASGSPDLTGAPLLQLVFASALTNAGGPIALVDFSFPPGPSVELTCDDAACDTATFQRAMLSGGVSGSAVAIVPVPAAVWLLSSALGFLGLTRKRQRA